MQFKNVIFWNKILFNGRLLLWLMGKMIGFNWLFECILFFIKSYILLSYGKYIGLLSVFNN